MLGGEKVNQIEKTGELSASRFTVRDFTELVKIGIVNSNTITAFTGMWLAFQLNGISFIQNVDVIFFTIVGSALIVLLRALLTMSSTVILTELWKEQKTDQQ